MKHKVLLAEEPQFNLQAENTEPEQKQSSYNPGIWINLLTISTENLNAVPPLIGQLRSFVWEKNSLYFYLFSKQNLIIF